MFLSRIFLVLALRLVLCSAVIYEDFSQLPSEEYDFVVVGGEILCMRYVYIGLNGKLGGTAGSVLANRLTENPRHSVLLIEAGGPSVNLPSSCHTRLTTRAGTLAIL